MRSIAKQHTPDKEQNAAYCNRSAFAPRVYFFTSLTTAFCLALATATIVEAAGPLNSQLVLFSGGATPDLGPLEEQRINFVKHTLSDRLKYVESGKRMLDFHQWIQSRGGDAAVRSMHGVEVDAHIEEDLYEEAPEAKLGLVQKIVARNDPFAINRLNLDLPLNNLPNLYQGEPIHLMDDREPSYMQLLARSIRLGFAFSPVISMAPLAACSKKFRVMWYKWLAKSLGTSGPAFQKWGQWAATRSDMFPDLLCQELEQLQSEVPAHSWAFSEKMMESSLGLPSGKILEVFDEFEQEPLASGSIAQVHRATLEGKPVAVKIRHPRVSQLIDMDFRIMHVFATICDWIPALSWLHVRESIDQFSHTMAAQAHLQVEAHHLEILNHNFRSWSHVRFPYPVYASSAVIIETFESGKIVSEVLNSYDVVAGKAQAPNVEEPGDEGERDMENSRRGCDLIPLDMAKFIVSTGVGIYLKMLLVDNLMHADLHPGNIMLQFYSKHEDPCKSAPLLSPKSVSQIAAASRNDHVDGNMRVTLVDAGMVAQLTEQESSTFIGLLASLGEGNGRLAAKFALRFSLENNALSPEEEEEFTQEMQDLFAERCKGYGGNVDVGDILRGVLGLIRKHKVRIDANYATLVVNALCVESLAKRTCPAYNVLDAAKPLLQAYFRTFYEPDGTPRPREKAVPRFKRQLPVMYVRKNFLDNAFFRKQGRAKKGTLKFP